MALHSRRSVVNGAAVDTLGALDVFLAAAERLSFADAGRRLGLSASAVGKGVARLEARLGVRLFHRTTRRVSLTAEGEFLYERGRRIREELDDVLAVLAEAAAEPQGRLRLSLPAIGYRFLGSHLAEFARAYPKVRLDLDFSDRMVDLVAEGVDATIRSGTLPDSTLMSRRLGRFRFLLCAAPSYIVERGEPASMAALGDHALIRFRPSGAESLQAWALVDLPPEAAMWAPAITCTNMEAVLAAAAAGLGVALMPDFLAREALTRGELVEVLPGRARDGVFWLLWPGRRASPKVRAFADFAAQRLFPASKRSPA